MRPYNSCPLVCFRMVPSAEVDEEQEHDPTTRTEAAVDMSPADQRAELEEYLNRSVCEKVNRMMAEMDARRARK